MKTPVKPATKRSPKAKKPSWVRFESDAKVLCTFATEREMLDFIARGSGAGHRVTDREGRKLTVKLV